MSYDDERQHEADEAEVTMFVGGGKTMSAGLVAYWYLMQTPVEGEDEPGGEVDERFVPVPEDELDRRLASLHERTVEPLPEDIESISGTDLYLSESEEGEGDSDSHETASSDASYISLLSHLYRSALSPVDRSWRWPPDSLFNFGLEEVGQEYSTVLLCSAGGSIKSSGRGNFVPIISPWSRRRNWLTDRRADSYRCKHDFWWDRLCVYWSERERDCERRRVDSESLMFEPFHPRNEPLRDAMQIYFTLHTTVTIVVDNLGAARDPNAALNSLIAEATSFSAAAADDGRWTLLVTAPAVRQECSHSVGRPRLAVMELPVDPPPESRQQNAIEESEVLLRRIRNELEALR
ncbi:hypothetical protein AB0I69_42490 [Streptomyces sp. NPDC050508]|uniref:hypothetical protein n=1 Tax=Streptomyces sp. NPDC050508 TaxID=3155405 RepID=UPI00343620AA